MPPVRLEFIGQPFFLIHVSHSSAAFRQTYDEWKPADVTVPADRRTANALRRHIMQERMGNPALVLPAAMQALTALGKVPAEAGLSPTLLELVNLRASQINGCSVCIDGHPRIAKKLGETDERLFAVSAWRDTPYFSDAERAALALTEAVTRTSDRADPVPDEIWDEATRHYDGRSLAALVVAIANINVWNRLNIATRQIAGAWKP
jgi:AhpD family alkylhydroperoxidase